MEATTNGSPLRAGDPEIRPAEFTAIAGDRPLRLTARELDLLTALVEREVRIVSREELYRTVWGERIPTTTLQRACPEALRVTAASDEANQRQGDIE